MVFRVNWSKCVVYVRWACSLSLFARIAMMWICASVIPCTTHTHKRTSTHIYVYAFSVLIGSGIFGFESVYVFFHQVGILTLSQKVCKRFCGWPFFICSYVCVCECVCVLWVSVFMHTNFSTFNYYFGDASTLSYIKFCNWPNEPVSRIATFWESKNDEDR